MTTMKSVRFHVKGDPDVLVYEDVPKPRPAPGQVLLRIEAAGVNFADTVRRSGAPYPQPSPLPFTLGGECVGVVEEVGETSLENLLGQRMFAFPGGGCYSEYAVSPVDRLFPMPAGLDPVQAIALFVQGLSAALILKSAARMQPGETVLVQGAAGGVGLLAVQLAKIYGAARVIGAASSHAKRELAAQHGADITVDYTNDSWAEQVRDATQGQGVDVVLEMTGGSIGRESLKLLAPFGRSIVYGVAGKEPLILDTGDLPPGNHTVAGFFLRPYLGRRELIEGLLQEFGDFVESGKLRIHVGGVFPLQRAHEAHRGLEERRLSGKLVLIP